MRSGSSNSVVLHESFPRLNTTKDKGLMKDLTLVGNGKLNSIVIYRLKKTANESSQRCKYSIASKRRTNKV